MRKLIVLSLCFCSLHSFTPPQQVPFFEGPFKEIQAKAEFSHMPFILYLYQNGCQDCEIMEEKTLNNPEIVSFIQDHYLATRKNLMTYEGRQLSQRLGSPFPGSLIIFSSESKVLEHIQEAIAPEELLALLQFHAGKSPSPHTLPPSTLTFEGYPEEKSQAFSEQPIYSQGNPPSPKREDPFARQSPSYSSRYLSAHIQEKQYEWYENSLQQGSSHSPAGFSHRNSNRRNVIYRDKGTFSQTRHKKYYGKASLRRAINYLKGKGIQDLSVFPQGKTLQGEPIYILRYTTKVSRNNGGSRVKLYRPSPYQGF